jgi:membrane fusion protein (multidrug efflux system)
VKKGDLLVRIDDRELAAENERAKANLELASQTLERGRRAIGSGAIPKTEFDKMQSDVNRLEAEARLYGVRLGQTSIVAPFDGVAGARAVSPGDYVDKETTITRIDDLSALKVEFQVPEGEIRHMNPGTHFTIDITPAGARTAGVSEVSGDVYFVSPIIDRTTRAAVVKGLVKNPPEILRPGMFVSVNLQIEKRPDVLVVPEGAIAVDSRGNAVVALKDGEPPTAEFVPVRTGLRGEGFVEIEPLQPGLDAGRRIVAAGVGGLILFPDAPLDPRPWVPPTLPEWPR